MIKEPAEAKALAEYFAAIVIMSSFPESEYPPQYKVKCRRRPNHRPCLEEIAGFISPDDDFIAWNCPKCKDGGFISNWRGSMWDLSNAVISH
jgi:hypothetical protein